MPTFADPLFNLPPLLSNPDPKIRLLFDHFCTYVSPVMLLYDDETNGYRHQILPLALSNPVIERAVCVAAAFHLSLRKPELRLPAESGRAAIINKLTEKTLDLSETTWATILLLIVADLVTGHEHVLTLYKMLRSFLDARRQAAPQLDAQGGSELQNFLYFQSKLLSFFASPVLGEPNALDGFSHISQDPFACLVRPAPHTKQSVGHVDPTSETPGSSSLDTVDARTELYMHTIREAAEIYLARARTSEHCSAAYPAGLEHSTILHTTGTTSTQRTEADDIISQRVVHMRRLFEQVDSSAPGAHALVWPAFVAAAESRREDDREFFSAALRQIWESTGYGNVLKGLNALPEIWERQEHGQEWTGVLTNLKTLIM
ncbi:hypothetical protein M406DRAFT_333137 [Cryphonectria parasitica EP155]|uniref:Uncharacterized protein n=1 Tax=Cryphonectria parasitica (strain ATCC 38755 / EP155) TaxID=660469 RepID=A0A9P4XXK5_CRYP1|nr:uncharacterized protein M406DRAFT_333137 [Cryphonectria parasitica EP155]KAF3762766.1 hypothetical protein M406DRAFT_333137 [Cryphonectria parasitica EP155]